MKLKKIASLMLAGVMAISMLAGCNGSNDKEDSASSNTTPTVTGITSEVYNNLDDAVKGIMSAKTMSALENILKTEFTAFTATDITADDITTDNALVGGSDGTGVDAVLTRLESSLGSKYTVYGNYGVAAGTEWDSKTIDDMEDKNVQLYAFSNQMSDGQINAAVAARVDALMQNAKTSDGQDKYAYNLSAAKITVGNSGNGYVVVAVVVEVVKTAA